MNDRVLKALRMAASPALWIAAFFAGAGRLDWFRGWLCVGLYFAGMSVVGIIVHRVNPSLIEARITWTRKDTKRFDKIFFALLI